MSNCKPTPRTKQAWCQRRVNKVQVVKKTSPLSRTRNCNQDYRENWWQR